ncbi:Signal transduction histidine kinase [Chishuiella changwenlii]|jgi:signal transduction histidine kinase|uniref:histidine kinase n=1 Tax=Chishuiella changwenlii TaxID=1434701 RepID=A0A1M7B905_9FLAO|nr:HAMP domain-containing sensor histidine kinase [Chishuiella changwenlii]GGE96192.1 two-component sensor histidine kinase [Chishuiella changwenlii]SHL51462.1 Signal transduction histidine kinase [Chishuiella changwenlii]
MKTYNKTVLIIVGIFIIYTVSLTTYIYYSFSNFEFIDFYKRLETRVNVITTEKDKNNEISYLLNSSLESLPSEKEYVIPIKDGNIADKILPEKVILQTLKNGKYEYNEGNLFYSSLLYNDKKGESFLIAVSAKNPNYSTHITYLRNLLIISVLFSILLMIFIAQLVYNTLIKPVKKIIKDVNKINYENLYLRLEVLHRKDQDPISELGHTFNGMLNRLETAFETQKNFISNASHELNTPLTSIIGEAELVLSKDRDKKEYEKSLCNILREAENLNNKTKALLFLARTGFDGKTQKFDIVRIDEILLNVKDNLQKINEGYKIRIDFSMLPENPSMLRIRGNEQLLHLAIANIVSNACKYSNNQEVRLALGATNHSIIIIIKDYGIGIPDDDMKYIYDPYFRASNTLNFEGYGIGLPLSRNIIRMHNGELIVQSKENVGTTVQISFPLDDV